MLQMLRPRNLVQSFAFGFVLLAVTESALAQQKPKLRPLHIALANHSVTMTPIYVAKHLGIFESYGYDARVLVLEPRAGLTALLTGELHFYTGIGSTARAALRGLDVRVALVALNRPDFALVASKDITGIEQLRGKTIGAYTPQGTVNVVLGEILRRKGLKPDDYKVVNAGTARAAALSAGTVQVAILNSVETVRMVKHGFHVLARAADELELPQSGLGMSRDSMQTKREFFRPAVQAVLDAIRVIMTQKDKTVPVLMKQLALNQDEAGYVYDGMLKGWAKDGRTTPGSMKLEFELDQRDMDLKEMPKPEQIYDYSILDELAKQKR
ncbi:MAG TPA: ABC transporter substrate-binding protein [Candidatus Saccharimonadales bacterium]|nr:ABC transporter substrate-binding protein [Candidatus Saccharimonadales bacterium]